MATSEIHSPESELRDAESKLDPPRRLRVYVIGYRELPKALSRKLIDHADITITLDAWQSVDDRARFDWVNQ